jgi:hypothetical protein
VKKQNPGKYETKPFQDGSLEESHPERAKGLMNADFSIADPLRCRDEFTPTTV